MPHMTRWRRRCRTSRRRMPRITMALVCSVLCIIISMARAQAIAQTSDGRQEDERRHWPTEECSDDDGTCSSSDRTNKLIYSNGGDAITLHTQTYASAEYGYKIKRELRKIQGSAPLLEKLERQRLRMQSEPGIDSIRSTIFDISTSLVEDLLSLALIHWDEWMHIVLEPTLESEEDLHNDHEYANDHFHKAANAYEAVLVVYKRLWLTMQPPSLHGNEEHAMFSLYDQEAISAGQASVYISLADMFQQRFNSRRDSATSDDCFAAYRYLIQSESWCTKSLSILGVTLEGSDDEEEISREEEDDHDTLVIEVKQSMAFVQVRLGSLLVDMYASGYILGSESATFTKPVVMDGHGEGERTQLGDGQTQILDLALKKLSKGLSLYSQLAAEEGSYPAIYGDYRLHIADSRNYMGVVHSHLLKWTAAAEQLEMSLSLYNELFNEYHESGMVSEAVDLASGMLQTTQSLWEAYLNLPRRTEDAKEPFRGHLALRRYFEREVSLGQPLADEEEGRDAYYSNHQDAYYGARNDGTTIDAHDEESLKTYQTMLNEYLQLQSEYLPDGSYYDMAFDWDGSSIPSYVQHDKVYEGSLRSVIGSLQLTQNKVWEAKGELELAVGLLREDAYRDSDSFEAYDENGEITEYPVKLELANALLNLAYAQLELKQWRSSFEAYEEAMDLYASELEDEETPMNHSTYAVEAKKGSQASWGDRLASYIKGSMGIEEETNSLGGNDGQEKGLSEDDTRYINLDGYKIGGNITSA